MDSLRSLRNILLPLTLLLTVAAAPARGDLADGEREFVQQLLDRGFFALAEQFCEEHLKSASNVDDRAEWELVLSECSQQHAWHLAEDSRNEMVSLAAQRITDFLKADSPTPEMDIQLRVRQIELLTVIGVMEETIRSRFTLDKATTTEPAPVPRTLRVSTKFALDAIAQGQELAETLSKQIEQLRRDLDPDVTRGSKDRIRFALARILLARSRLVQDAQSVPQRDQAKVLAEQLLKSTTDDSLRFRIRLLLAEIQIDQNDFAAFNLKLGNLLSSASTDEDRSSVSALKIRSLLEQGQPSEALQEFVNASQNGLALTQELQTARFQSLLQLMELLDQLEDSSQSVELKKKTADEFLLLKEKTLALTSGVWRERCQRIGDRFDRVQQVGSEAASDLEEIAALVDQGHLPAAKKTLQVLIQRFGTKRPRELAGLLLQSGNLGIRERDWSSAAVDLLKSRQLFLEVQDQSSAAAADLLRVYSLGQQWDSAANPAGNAASNSSVTEADYKNALDEHVRMFEGQVTIAKAKEWRARLLRTTDPLASAKELLDALQPTKSPSDAVQTPSTLPPEQRLELLCLAGDHLLEAMAKLSSVQNSEPFAKELSALSERFATESTTARSSTPDPGSNVDSAQDEIVQRELLLAVLQTEELGLSMRHAASPAVDWKTLEAEARRLLALLSVVDQPVASSKESSSSNSKGSLTNANPSSETDQEKLVARTANLCHALICLASFRQLSDPATFSSSRQFLVALSLGNRFRTVRQLLIQLPGQPKGVPGDNQLALFLMELVTAPSVGNSEAIDFDHQLDELQILKRLFELSGTSSAYQSRLDALMAMPLSDTQLTALVDVVTRDGSSVDAKSGSATSSKFWQSVQKKTKPGQAGWFEASLQLAALSAAKGDRKEAMRILGVVSVLHPDWGSPSRKERADQLQKKIEATP